MGQSPELLSAPRRVAGQVDIVLGEWPAKESWDGVPISGLTSYFPKRFCKPARKEEIKWVGEDNLEVPVPQPSTLWPG